MTPNERFARIVDDNLCIGCGLCQSLAGPNLITVEKSSEGELRPIVHGQLSAGLVDGIWAVCPGTRVQGLPDNLTAEAPTIDPVWGPLHRIALGWASDPVVRHEGSTGGVLTALGQYLLRSHRVDFILHVRASANDPSFGMPTLSFTEAEVLDAAGSRYGPTAPLIDLDGALNLGRPFALIAKPCDLSAVRSLARSDERVNRLIRYWLAPVCGGYMPDAGLSDVFGRREIDRDNVGSLRYRGRGCPGPTTIGMVDGSEIAMHYLDFWGEDESAWSLPFRCKICPDGTGEAADIAAADTWPGGSPDRLGSATDPGINSLLIRSRAGLDLVKAAVRDGALTLGDNVGTEFLDATQPHQVSKKRFAHARLAGLRDLGSLAPECVGLRLDELAGSNHPSDNFAQREGAMRRARAFGRPTG